MEHELQRTNYGSTKTEKTLRRTEYGARTTKHKLRNTNYGTQTTVTYKAGGRPMGVNLAPSGAT